MVGVLFPLAGRLADGWLRVVGSGGSYWNCKDERDTVGCCFVRNAMASTVDIAGLGVYCSCDAVRGGGVWK